MHCKILESCEKDSVVFIPSGNENWKWKMLIVTELH